MHFCVRLLFLGNQGVGIAIVIPQFSCHKFGMQKRGLLFVPRFFYLFGRRHPPRALLPYNLPLLLLFAFLLPAHRGQALAGSLPRRPRLHSNLIQDSVTALGRLPDAEAARLDLDLTWSRFRAVTVVHAPCSTLAFTLTNFAGNLGPDWPLLVVYSPGAEATVLGDKAVRSLSRTGGLEAVPLSALNVPGLDELETVSDYSRLLAHPNFWQAMHADKVLIFQADSVLCSASPFSVDDFLAYDYIGAPWIQANHAVGNGGLSLRSVRKMLHIAQHFDRPVHPEDVFFADGLADLAQRDDTVVLASSSVANKFSWEMDTEPPEHVPFGVHRSNIVPAELKAAITRGCPEARIGVWTSCGRGASSTEEGTLA